MQDDQQPNPTGRESASRALSRRQPRANRAAKGEQVAETIAHDVPH